MAEVPWSTVIAPAASKCDVPMGSTEPSPGGALIAAGAGGGGVLLPAAAFAGAAPPAGGACANRPSGWSVSRSTGRTDRRSKRKDSAELAPTPSRTFRQSSPDVLSTTAHPARSTFSWSPSTTR